MSTQCGDNLAVGQPLGEVDHVTEVLLEVAPAVVRSQPLGPRADDPLERRLDGLGDAGTAGNKPAGKWALGARFLAMWEAYMLAGQASSEPFAGPLPRPVRICTHGADGPGRIPRPPRRRPACPPTATPRRCRPKSDNGAYVR